MPTASLAFQAIDYLVTLWSAALPGIEVRDGAETTNVPKTGALLLVGYTDNPDNPVIHAAQELSPMGNDWTNETVTIASQLSIVVGDTDMKACRDSVAAYLGTAFSAIRSDKLLGGLLAQGSFAWPDQWTLKEGETQAGAEVVMDFTIIMHVQAWAG